MKEGNYILINLYDIKNYCKNFNYETNNKTFNEKDCYFVIHNWIKRNFKYYIKKDIIIDNILKKNIEFYRLDLIIDLMFHKAKKHKTGETHIAKMFRYFVKNIKLNIKDIEDKKLKMQINQFPKPKVYREIYKSWYLLWNKIKILKKLKRINKFNNKEILNKLKEDKKILGIYIAYKETKSKNLESFYKKYEELINHYKLKDKDFKPKNIYEFEEKAKEELQNENLL